MRLLKNILLMLPLTLFVGYTISASPQSCDNKLVEAARCGSTDTVRTLITKGVDLDARDSYYGTTALVTASARGHIEIVKALIDAGANANALHKGGHTALSNAAFSGRKDIIDLLINNGAPIKGNSGNLSLINACYRGHQDIAEFFIKNGADVNVKDNVGDTALKLAKRYGYTDIVDIIKNHIGVRQRP